MIDRRNFLKLGALFVPAVAAPTVAYSFLWGAEPVEVIDWVAFNCGVYRRMAAALQVPVSMLNGDMLAQRSVVHWERAGQL